ncbi:MAG: helix-turn-helix domain-containing protein [Solirubrobacteraceae bacterium]|nr:helix-turn-helix domain-containing protein [Solirubrobacteraceae bacterium]
MQAATADIIRASATALEASLDAMVEEVSHAIASEVPDVLDDDSYRASNRANLSLKLAVLRRGDALSVPDAPHDALLYARDLARRGADVSVLLRAYDLGHRYFWTQWTRECAARTADPAVLNELYDVSARFLFAYFDAVPAAVTSAYRDELARRTDTGEARRAEAVCGVLGGLVGDVRPIERELGYPLAGTRHVALICDDPAPAARTALLRAGRAAASAALVVRVEAPALWAWFASPDLAALEDALGRHAALDGATLALGDAATGVDGFRDSHREAQLALRHGRGERRLVRYRDLGAASLLAGDPRRARRFVERELGALAAPDPATSRVRDTVRVYLQENGSQAGAARRLGVHVNTVAYRLRRAEELLGRRVTDRRFDLEAALLLHAREAGR